MDVLPIVAGIATALNFSIIYLKFKWKLYESALIDSAVLLSVSYLFFGTISGMTAGMVSSVIFSIILLLFPPNFKLI